MTLLLGTSLCRLKAASVSKVGQGGDDLPPASGLSKLSARSLVLDGEVAIHDQQLRSRFDCLREPDPKAVATPPLFMAFDLLYHKRRDLTARPLRDSRARQEAKSGPRPPGHQARARGRQHAGRLRSSTTGRWAAGARHAVGDARHGSHRDHRSGARSRRMRGDEGRRDPAAATGAGGDVRAVGRSVVLPVGANRRLLPGRRRDRRRAPLHRRHVRGAVVRMNACASRGRSRWPALVPADLYLDAANQGERPR